MILAPKAVLGQWQNELYEKFNLLVPIYTGSSLRWRAHHGADAPLERSVIRPQWTQEPIVLASSHLLRRRQRQAEVLEAEDWDLVIVDEAHHARRRAPGTPREGGPNRLLRLLRGPTDGSTKGLKGKALSFQKRKGGRIATFDEALDDTYGEMGSGVDALPEKRGRAGKGD